MHRHTPSGAREIEQKFHLTGRITITTQQAKNLTRTHRLRMEFRHFHLSLVFRRMSVCVCVISSGSDNKNPSENGGRYDGEFQKIFMIFMSYGDLTNYQCSVTFPRPYSRDLPPATSAFGASVRLFCGESKILLYPLLFFPINTESNVDFGIYACTKHFLIRQFSERVLCTMLASAV